MTSFTFCLLVIEMCTVLEPVALLVLDVKGKSCVLNHSLWPGKWGDPGPEGGFWLPVSLVLKHLQSSGCVSCEFHVRAACVDSTLQFTFLIRTPLCLSQSQVNLEGRGRTSWALMVGDAPETGMNLCAVCAPARSEQSPDPKTNVGDSCPCEAALESPAWRPEAILVLLKQSLVFSGN